MTQMTAAAAQMYCNCIREGKLHFTADSGGGAVRGALLYEISEICFAGSCGRNGYLYVLCI